MNNSRNIWMIVIAAALLIAMLLYLFQPSTGKSDTEASKPIDWNQHYKEQSKAPYGTNIFYELIEHYYTKHHNGTTSSDDLPELDEIKEKDPYLLFYIGRKLDLSDDVSRKFFRFVENGNYLFISAESFSYYFREMIEEDFELSTIRSKTIKTSFLPRELNPEVKYEHKFIFEGKANNYDWHYLHSAKSFSELESERLPEATIDIPEESLYEDEYDEEYTDEYTEDEVVTDPDDEEDDYEYDEEDYSYESESVYKSYLLKKTDVIEVMPDNRVTYVAFHYGEGIFFVYLTPIAFSNISLLEEKNLHHLEHVLSAIPAANLIMDEQHQYLQNGNNGDDNYNSRGQSPLQFILSVPSLKWAYYLTLATLFFYVIFRIKRKARAIPAVQKNENSTMEFASTVSELYFQKAEHRSVMKHKEKLFLHFIREKYFMSSKESDDNFFRILSNKSQIPEEKIKDIFNDFSRLHKGLVTENDLISLHHKTEYFYKNCK